MPRHIKKDLEEVLYSETQKVFFRLMPKRKRFLRLEMISSTMGKDDMKLSLNKDNQKLRLQKSKTS